MEYNESSQFINKEVKDKVEILDQCGTTSLAYKTNLNGQCCFIKRLRPELCNDKRYRELFHKEYHTGKKIDSPYVVKYLDIVDDDKELCLIMEYVNGCTLKEKIEKEPEYFKREENIRKLLLQLCEALKALHNANVVHLDINPGNIIISRISNSVKLVDLGFCVSDWNDRSAGTTAMFGSPETVFNEVGEIDARSDIYSIGCLLRYIEDKAGAKLSRSLHNFMARCLSKEKKLRFADCDEAIKALRRQNPIKHAATIAACLILAAVAVTAIITRYEKNRSTTTLTGVEYKVLSHENSTCAVTGGEGKGNNIYIEPEVTIGGKVYQTIAINDSAFKKRDILSVYIPDGVKIIGRGAFNQCDSITTLNLPNSIADYTGAFIEMKGLKRVSFPQTKEISPNAFVSCYSLESIHIPEGVECICLDAFVSCTSLKNVSLPQTLKEIKRGVFYNCTALEEITIPAGVEEIGDYAFYECDSLRAVYCHATTPPRITAIFDSPNVTVYVPAEAVEAYKKDFNWREYNLQPMV